MKRRTVEIVLVAVVAVVVVSIAASTLDSTASSSGAGLGGTNESGDAVFPGGPTNVSSAAGGITPPPEVMSIVLAVGFLGSIWYLLRNPRKSIALFAGMAFAFLALLAVGELLSELIGDTPGTGEGGLLGGGFGVSGGGIQEYDSTQLPLESLELLAVLALGVVLVGVILYVSDDPTDLDSGVEAGERDDVSGVGSIGRAAGDAADRIENDAEVDNEVYRAWVEMTDLLDVSHPDTSTPADFAAAAVDAGMRREDVEELTALFRSIRYGPDEATDRDERRALDALHRIESTYAPGDE